MNGRTRSGRFFSGRAMLLSLLAGLLAGCSTYYQGPASTHFDGQRFFNPEKPMNKGFLQFLQWQLTAQKQPWPAYSELPVRDQPPTRVGGNDLRIAFVGHATVLIQTQGMNILTDPVWSRRASPVQWAGPARVHPPGIAFDDLPVIDAVLISHNHYDHLDLMTVERLWNRDQPRIVVPLGNDAIIRAHNPDIATEAYDWGESFVLGEQVRVTLEPMQHWSARGLFDRNKALWAAFVLLTPGGNVYFAGDSGYGDHFAATRQKYGAFRLAMLPIGSYDPRWFMSYGHMNPAEAVQAFRDLHSLHMLPLHYGMFQLADTGYEEPLVALQSAMEADGITERQIRAVGAGEFWMVP